jgi:hypothetical protein
LPGPGALRSLDDKCFSTRSTCPTFLDTFLVR